MSALTLKLIACAAMLLDHIGYSMQYYGVGGNDIAVLFRTVGRIAFPIFAFLIAEGFKKTHNVALYTVRVLIAGLISEVPYDLCFHGRIVYESSFNVMFTFAISLVALVFTDMCIKSSRREYRLFCLFPIVGAYYIADKTAVDYAGFGVLLVILLYFADGEGIKSKLGEIVVVLLFAARFVLVDLLSGGEPTVWHKTQLYAALALIPILLYNGKKGHTPKGRAARKLWQYSFYLFYPAHILLLYLVFSNYHGAIAALLS